MGILEKIKNFTTAAFRRFFNSEKKKYEKIMAELKSLSALTSTPTPFVSISSDDFGDVNTIDIENVDVGSRRRAKKSGVTHTINKFVAPNAKDLLANTRAFIEAEEQIKNFEVTLAGMEARMDETLVSGSDLTRKIRGLNLNTLKSLDGVSQGQNGVISNTDSLVVTVKQGADKKKVASAIRSNLKKVIARDPKNLRLKLSSSRKGRNEVIIVRFFESSKANAAEIKMYGQMKEYLANLKAQLEKAQEQLMAFADEHVPKDVRQLSVTALEHLTSILDDSIYDSFYETMYLTNTDTGSVLTFTSYIEVLGLDKDIGGTGEFILAITSKLTKDNDNYTIKSYVNGLRGFIRPGDFPLGKEIDASEIDFKNKKKPKFRREITSVLSLSGIQFDLASYALDIPQMAFKNSGINDIPGVISSKLMDRRVLVRTNNLDDNIINNEIYPEVQLILRKLLRTKRGVNKFGFSKQILKSKNGTKVLVIARTPRQVHDD